MAIEKTYARFLTPVSEPVAGKKILKTEEYSLQYVEYDEETTKQLLEEASKYYVGKNKSYSYENDVYNTQSSSTSYSGIRADKLISISSMMYSTDEPQADCLIIDGHFAGVVVLIEQKGGNGWSNYCYTNYAVLYTDGRISGNNVSCYSFNGEDSSREDTNRYTLHKVPQGK